ncbi:superoxide dismutase [Haloplasma contractile]|uniref:Superoxide dismutase n=1 Tax=Haloplasma contractile SSD-17B TaxID=1033810 RepID=U2EFU1_9MOLU|nr:superoxide dismutase [Haloplasma contractile]ERJ13793.1 Superoxide dismutase Mn 1 protein [Haloplasma contractile SSD-17B]
MPDFKAADLPYSYDALEPHIDAKTVEIHYEKHHKGYATKLNAALKGHEDFALNKSIEDMLKDVNSIPEDFRQKVINFAGGVHNHNIFWLGMSPNGGGNPKGELAKKINEKFGSYDHFKDKLGAASKTVFGSGYGYLVVCNDTKELEIMQTFNQDSPLSFNKTPLMTIDVWEHAYYLKYQNVRPDFVDNIFNLVDWDVIEKRYQDAIK